MNICVCDKTPCLSIRRAAWEAGLPADHPAASEMVWFQGFLCMERSNEVGLVDFGLLSCPGVGWSCGVSRALSRHGFWCQ